MESLSTIFAQDPATSLLLGGLAIGLVFGATAQRTGFCTLGAVSDWLLFGDVRRRNAWILAVAIAVAATQALHWAAIVDLDRSLYRSGVLPLGGHLAGGLLFGFGMTLAGGCVSRNLVRAGAGDLLSLLTLAMLAIVVAIALGGLLGPLRLAIMQATSVTMPAHLGGGAALLAGSVTALSLAAISFASASFRGSPRHVAAGVIVGLCVAAGWALSGLAFDAFADAPAEPASLTFVKPLADSLDWLERFTALGPPGFAVASVLGTIAGAAAMAGVTGTFRLATFNDVSDTLRHMLGAALMALGGVLALGCSIGQGVTGLSTLALGSVVATAAIVAGAAIALKVMERYSTLT